MDYKQCLVNTLISVKAKNPLVHHLTNYVTVNDCANVVLALGGSPIMAEDQAEVQEITALASALVLNIGTLKKDQIESMLLAGQKANEKGIPVILDPVGVGASSWRMETTLLMLEKIKFAVIRGNLAEIKALAGLPCRARGVDSLESPEESSPNKTENNNGKNKGEFVGDSLGEDRERLEQTRQIAFSLAQKHHCVAAVTGAVDVVVASKNTCFIRNGHELLSRVTGTGCMVTSLIGTCCGATEDFFAAAVTAIISMNLAGEKAAHSLKKAEGLGTFKVKLFDYLSTLTSQELSEGAKISEK